MYILYAMRLKIIDLIMYKRKYSFNIYNAIRNCCIFIVECISSGDVLDIYS